MDFIDKKITSYVDAHTSNESELLYEIDRYTHLNVMRPRMLSGSFQGRVLSMLSKIIRPKKVLEIGTYTGYSALCMAEGLAENGTIDTIDINEEIEDLVRGFFSKSKYNDQINYIIGNALEEIDRLEGGWDLVFIDADKKNYQKYFDLVLPKVNAGGMIVADNVLWSGKVLDTEFEAQDKDTPALIAFNDAIQADSRVENVLMPIRDGLMLIRKK